MSEPSPGMLQERADPARFRTGPAIGERMPEFALPDHRGLEVNWDRVRADRRAVIHFFRTTEWCPFCVAQLVELQEHAAEYEMRQIAVFAISPDPPPRLAEFVAQNGITYAMLSDAGSRVIRRLGLLNAEVAESDPVYGIPYPGSLLIDRKGYIFEKRFHPDFHVREPMGSLLLYFELKDYSERLEEKVAERTRDLEQAQLQMIETARVATLGKLVAAINHELNTPVGALASGLELMWNHYLPSGSQQQPGLPDLRRAIEAATARIVQVVAGLREFVRLDESEAERADLRRSLDTVAELLGSEANSGITVRRDYEEIPPVYCRAAQVNQALWEVVTNSVESIGPQGTITLSARREDGHVVLRVADTGRGIPAEHLRELFEPRLRTKEGRMRMSLGLALASKIIHEQGGHIEVSSAPGRGTTVAISFPEAR